MLFWPVPLGVNDAPRSIKELPITVERLGPCDGQGIFHIDNDNNDRIDRRDSRFFFFYNLLTAPRTVCNTYTQVAMAQLCANHVQHIGRSSRVTCVPRGTKGQFSY